MLPAFARSNEVEKNSSEYEMARSGKYPIDRILETALLKSMKRAVKKEYPSVKENIMFVWTLEHAIRHLENR